MHKLCFFFVVMEQPLQIEVFFVCLFVKFIKCHCHPVSASAWDTGTFVSSVLEQLQTLLSLQLRKRVSQTCVKHQIKLVLCVFIFIFSGRREKHKMLFCFQNLTKEMADYCVARMKPYVDPKTERPIAGALDYIEFTRTLFQN
jgi:hypothetical protein